MSGRRDFRDLDLDEPDHCAKFSPAILEVIAAELPRLALLEGVGRPRKPLRVLDSFAGVGRIHLLRDLYGLPVNTVGVELEEPWAAAHERTVLGDARDLEAAGIRPGTVDAYVTSPTYGSRMADSFNARDSSKRNTYHHSLGRRPSAGSSAVMRWGTEYRKLHLAAYSAAAVALTRPGIVLLNVSNHLERTVKGDPTSVVEWPVVEWHLKAWLHLGGLLRGVIPIETPRNGNGANRDVRTSHEYLLELVLPALEAPAR